MELFAQAGVMAVGLSTAACQRDKLGWPAERAALPPPCVPLGSQLAAQREVGGSAWEAHPDSLLTQRLFL